MPGKAEYYIKKYAPLALAVIGSMGVVATAVAASKATAKAAEEPEDEQWKCYVPTALIGAGTIICIMGSAILNERKIQNLTSAYALLYSSFNEYKCKVIEHHGIDAHNQIMEELRAEKASEVNISCGFLASDAIGFFDEDEEPKLFYDEVSKRYFEARPSAVLQAEYHMNRNYILGWNCTMNDWYEFLGLEPIENGDQMYIDIESGIMWIDFNHRHVRLEDGLECWCVEMLTAFNGPEDG